MAYVTHLKPDGTYQPLKAHEENVAALAGKFAEAFDAKAHGERTGLLHDIGKYSDNGQKRRAIRNTRPRWITPRRERRWHGN